VKLQSTALVLVFIAVSASPVLWAQANKGPEISAPATAQSEMRIGAGDLLSVGVFDTPELSGNFRVDENGVTSFPLIGTVHLAGLSTEQAQQLIQSKLVEGNFVKHPQVTVLITEYATQGITILGEVKTPGVYPALGGKHLFDLIAMASGLTPTAGNLVTVTHRYHPSNPITVPLRSSNGELTSNIALQPGDTVVVQRAGIVYVLGDVGRPGGFVIDSDYMTVVQALALAQGAATTASLNKAKLLRRTASGVKEIPLPLKAILQSKIPDQVVQAGDIIFVPSSAAKSIIHGGFQGILQSALVATIYRL